MDIPSANGTEEADHAGPHDAITTLGSSGSKTDNSDRQDPSQTTQRIRQDAEQTTLQETPRIAGSLEWVNLRESCPQAPSRATSTVRRASMPPQRPPRHLAGVRSQLPEGERRPHDPGCESRHRRVAPGADRAQSGPAEPPLRKMRSPPQTRSTGIGSRRMGRRQAASVTDRSSGACSSSRPRFVGCRPRAPCAGS